jgi:hypothetical protein
MRVTYDEDTAEALGQKAMDEKRHNSEYADRIEHVS